MVACRATGRGTLLLPWNNRNAHAGEATYFGGSPSIQLPVLITVWVVGAVEIQPLVLTRYPPRSPNRSMYSATSASRAVISIRRAPSRASVSSVGGSDGSSSGPTLPTPSPANVVVCSSPAAGCLRSCCRVPSAWVVSPSPGVPARVFWVDSHGRIRHLSHAPIHNIRLYSTEQRDGRIERGHGDQRCQNSR